MFTLISLLIALYMVFRTGDLRLERQPGYNVLVDFPDVAGLDVGDTVRVAGVEVGKVESINLKENLGRVTLSIDHRVPLYEDATAQVETYGLLGRSLHQHRPGALETATGGTRVEKSIRPSRRRSSTPFSPS